MNWLKPLDKPLHLIRGHKYEQQALRYLKAQGHKLLCKNYRCRYGEIDLIVQDKEYIVFVEVKFRSRSDFGLAQEMVTPDKQKKIKLAAQTYLMQNNALNQPCRFDVVSFSGDNARQPDWFENAF